MKAPYAIAVLVALGLAGCKAEVTPAGPTGSSTSSTTVVKDIGKTRFEVPADARRRLAPNNVASVQTPRAK